MKLRLCVFHIKEHPQVLMKKLGITYKKSTAHPIGDCWVFEDCENVPEELPEYLDIIKEV